VTILGEGLLKEFQIKYARARKSVPGWLEAMKDGQWSNFASLRDSIPSADQVTSDKGTVYTVFNLGGNLYRIIALVEYSMKAVRIKEVLTHEQYNRWEPK
jgi:mRNA interferase HigB